jgi:hypothetical protein
VNYIASTVTAFGLTPVSFLQVIASICTLGCVCKDDQCTLRFVADGDLVNIGADFCMMPSMFEPGGIVQQEFFVAGTPVIAYKTGGLKDTVVEFDPAKRAGNGFVFEGYAVTDFVMAFRRAKGVFYDVELYNAIRANARDSVMDLAVVSKAWFREFHRVRRCLPPPVRKFVQKVPINFTIHVGDLPFLYDTSEVEVTGSFSGWKAKHTATRTGDVFEVRIDLPPGVHQYKFIIDGKWTNAPKQPTIDDGTGNRKCGVTCSNPSAFARIYVAFCSEQSLDGGRPTS